MCVMPSSIDDNTYVRWERLRMYSLLFVTFISTVFFISPLWAIDIESDLQIHIVMDETPRDLGPHHFPVTLHQAKLSDSFVPSCEFNGRNSYMELSGSEKLDFPAGPYTVCAWVLAKKQNFGDSCAIVSKHVAGTFNGFKLSYHGYGRHDRFYFYSGGDPPVFASELHVDQDWHHVCGVSDGKIMTLYVDGQPVGSQKVSYWNPSPAPIRIGAYVGYHTYFHGLIGEVRIYRRGLSPDEVLQLATPHPSRSFSD